MPLPRERYAKYQAYFKAYVRGGGQLEHVHPAGRIPASPLRLTTLQIELVGEEAICHGEGLGL